MSMIRQTLHPTALTTKLVGNKQTNRDKLDPFITKAVTTNQTNIRLTGSVSRTSWVSQHQKCSTNLDFNAERDDRVAVTSAGPYANHMHLTPDR